MSSSGNPSYVLSQSALNQLAGLLEPLEGFGGVPTNSGNLYNVGQLVLVGYGLQLTDPNGLPAALEALTETVTVPVNAVNQSFSPWSARSTRSPTRMRRFWRRISAMP